MEIYDEFVDVIRDLIGKIIAHEFDQVLYGNSQPMSQLLREKVILSSRPVTPGGKNLTFQNITKEDLKDLINSEELLVLRFNPKPPRYLEEIIDENDGILPPLDRSQISNWEFDGINIYSNENPRHYLKIKICVNVTPDEINCNIIEID